MSGLKNCPGQRTKQDAAISIAVMVKLIVGENTKTTKDTKMHNRLYGSHTKGKHTKTIKNG
jgi:hypothetical protein